WVLSDPVTEKKSVFLGHAVRVTSSAEAKHFVAELIASDKRLQRATHNMYAYRIKLPPPSQGWVQDNDDDGETAAGSRLAHLLSVMGVENVLVVVARWYGGIKLGGDRFRIIGAVGREAVVRLL
ncbi:ribosomal protein S5 domain 2-type protein, partial [Kalaharituber pfeilii]